MNVLELCLSPGLGGLELYVFRTAQALTNSHTLNNNVISIVADDSKLRTYFINNSDIKTLSLKPLFTSLPVVNAKKISTIIDKSQIDVIHIHWGKDLPLAALAKIFSRRKPALVYTRQMMITRKKDDFYHTAQYKQMDLMLTITKELEILCKKYIPCASHKIKNLYHGVAAPESFLSKSDIQSQRKLFNYANEDFIIGLFGRLEDCKGQHLLIEAIAKARQNGNIFRALIVGHEMNAGYTEKLKRLAEQLGVLDQINFHDFVNDPQNLMQLCDCVVLATTEETFGLVLPEAMRAGITVVGSDSGGVPEIIDHGKTGLLFKTKNSNNLCEQLEKLYINPEYKQLLANNGKLSADIRFNNDLHFQQLEHHFLSVIAKN